MELHERRCEPCRGGVPPLAPREAEALLARLTGWRMVEGHHADFELGWGRASARIWTHKVDGLTEADFVLAAKLDRI